MKEKLPLFTFLLVKAASYFPRYRENKKWIDVPAKDSVEARKYIETNYSDWQVSMFWPKAEIRDGKYIHLTT